MDTNQEAAIAVAGPARDIDWPGRARTLAPLIAAEAAATEAAYRVTDKVMAAMHDAELFRMCLPRTIGGPEATPLEVMEVLEAVANADASTAWCLGQALGVSRLAGYVDPAIAREIFNAPDAIVAWGPEKSRTVAVMTEGGYRITGEWMFASGIRNATWLGAHCAIVEADGTPRLLADGKPLVLTMLLPVSKARIIDVWRVMGLRGTGSDNYIIEDVFVPEGFAFRRDDPEYRREHGPLYTLNITSFFAIGFAGVALGIARGGLDDFIAMAQTKVAQYTTSRLSENAAMQQKLAHVEAGLGAARAYLVEQSQRAWDTMCAGDPLSVDQRVRLRLACSHAIVQARDAVAFAYHAAGSSALLESHPFERRFRDMNSVSQQVQGQPVNFEQAGRILFGVDQESTRF